MKNNVYLWSVEKVLRFMVESPYTVEVKKIRRKYRSVIKPEMVEVVDRSTGAVEGATRLVTNMRLYDTTDFVKLYDWHVLLDLSKSGVVVLSYVLNELRFDGHIQFSSDKCMRYSGCSRSSVYNGLNELLGLDILRRDKLDNNKYYVNPNVAFRGDRSKIVGVF